MTATTRSCVVFDFDRTLVHGDSGSQLIRALLARAGWRRALAVLALPIGLPLLAFDATFRVGASIFFWLATVGISETELDRLVSAFCDRHSFVPIDTAVAALQSELDAGNHVVVATGAFQPLAERLVARLGLRGQPRVVGSTVRAWRGGFVSHQHARGKSKLARLAECGLHPPFARAWSDSLVDLPLLRAATESHWVMTGVSAPTRLLRVLPRVIVHRV